MTGLCANGLDRATAYRVGLCVVCGVKPYSAGRTRCNACHEAAAAVIDPDTEADQLEIYVRSCDAFGMCRNRDCSEPALFGRVLCAGHLQRFQCRCLGCDKFTPPGRVMCDVCLTARAKAK